MNMRGAWTASGIQFQDDAEQYRCDDAAFVHGLRATGANEGNQQARRRSSSMGRPAGRAVMVRGPERFFYDKSSYTGTHACGGPDHVPKGEGTSHGKEFWTRPHDLTLLTRASQLSKAVEAAKDAPVATPATTAAGEDRTRMQCPTCGYKCVPQWLNDEAHCLKCQAVLKRRPSVHERAARAQRPPSRGATPTRPDSRGGARRPSSCGATPSRPSSGSGSRGDGQARRMVGPERFFYDKSTYTGTHLRGGPSSVAKGSGSAWDQSWKRP
eukprot:TRINITY_DN14935_c0_g1_i1.p1 TRINITY_DN14935_c0_g1~~TRINITY_DN14935_c0_g1_i1.p1  ORF type:complete len:269 (+),score=25.64 TRINITY_DN14935_c0_g1_i1:84-890(+)